ncbi:MAG: threonine synthase [Desulfurococcaceae archaeon]
MIRWEDLRKRKFCVWRYRELLPLSDSIDPVTLCEGGTPLIPITKAGNNKVYLKFEGSNPTGSFKDRGMTVAITIARHIEVKGVIVASTGNTAASAAAYAARAGLRCVVVLPKGSVAIGKLAQAMLYGAEVVEVDGLFDEALDNVLELVVTKGRRDLYPLNSYNPWRLEGQKTIAYEIVEELGKSPDAVFVPVGNAGNIYAVWKGFKELHENGIIESVPRMIGVQAEGASPLVLTWRSKSSSLLPVSVPRTIASAIRIGKPVNWPKALNAVNESGGSFISVSDSEIKDAMKKLAVTEGVGVEPASATTLAGYIKSLEDRILTKSETVVLVGTGHVLKDPDAVFKILSPEKISA